MAQKRYGSRVACLKRRDSEDVGLRIAPDFAAEAWGQVGQLQDLVVAGAWPAGTVAAPEADLPAATGPFSTAPSLTTS